MWRACVAQVLFLLALWPLATHIKDTSLPGGAVVDECEDGAPPVGASCLLASNNTTTWEVRLAGCTKNFTYPVSPYANRAACSLACQNFNVAPMCWNFNDWEHFSFYLGGCTCQGNERKSFMPLVVH